ncbi:hypothetical protein ACUOA8_11740, partial [Escherichia sp. SS-MK2]
PGAALPKSGISLPVHLLPFHWISIRGFIRAVAVVTRRLKPLNVNGQQVETVGIPIHWGFEGVARKGYIANTLTPNVGDANSQTPEYKAFLVNIEKA